MDAENRFSRRLGTVLKTIRKRRGITQEEMARHTGLLQSSYSRVEAGSQHLTPFKFYTASKILKVTPDMLMMLVERMERCDAGDHRLWDNPKKKRAPETCFICGAQRRMG